VLVPEDALWGANTQRAVENFPVSGERLPRELIGALASIKGAAATVNARLGVLEPDMAEAIHDAAAEVARGDYDDQFPIDVFQTGSGTSSNMNANEVIATLATRRLGRPVHPNDDVNASQSSNDVFPSAIHIAAALMIKRSLLLALDRLAAALDAKATEFADVVKSGRTHLMDATPVTLGQEFGGFAAAVIARLAEDMGLPLTEARDHFEAAGGRDALVAASGVLRSIAVSEYKICNDLRLMNSGPLTGLAEIRVPDLQPGSSIMPGKVNPVICEAVCQVCAQVIGNDAAVAFGGAAGNFELNVMMPVIGQNLLDSIRLLSSASRLLADRCVDGIVADVERMRRFAESSPSIVTALNRFLGYEEASAVAHEALATGKTIRDVVILRGHVERGDLTEEQLDAALDVMAMTRPGTQ
jgi:fumarate hydratase class II